MDFSLIDMSGIIVAVVGYLIVFFALVALYFVFFFIAKILKVLRHKRLKKQGREDCIGKEPISGELNAAISMALFLYINEQHDEESNVMTIRKISRRYSPWNSKIYGLRNFDKPRSSL